MRRPALRRGSAGFTLVEVLVALVVMATMAAMAAVAAVAILFKKVESNSR